MDKVEGELKLYSPVLIGEYIRQFTAVRYINNPETDGAFFAVTPENYEKFTASGIKTPLIGMTLSYNAEKQLLKVTADERFIKQYTNKIINDMALKYAEYYLNRYASFILYKD